MTFLISLFILIMQFLWLYIDELVGKGLSFLVILEFLGWGSATILPLALPLATLLASIMTLGGMGENNELLAMKAAGVSLQRILYPLIYISVAISIGAFFISNNLIPISYNKIFTLQYDIGRTKEEIKIPAGTFYNGIDGYTLRISSRNSKTDMMYDVIIYDHSKNKGNTSLAVADSGYIKATNDKKSLVFKLYNGSSFEETNTRKYRDTSFVLQRVDFTMQEVIIPLENYAFQKSEDEKYGNEIMSKKLNQLRHDRDSIGEIYNNIYISHQRKFIYNSSLTYNSQLDSARNKGIRQANKIDLDSIYKWESAQDELDDIRQAVMEVNSAKSMLESFERESYEYTYSLRRIDIESYRKFALSFACLIFFFIGAPLGAIIRKGGLGTPVIVSALFFVLYWVVDISGKKLSRDGVISPFIGAFISSIVLLPIGAFLTWKSTKDSSLFDADALINNITKFFKKIDSNQWQKKKQK